MTPLLRPGDVVCVRSIGDRLSPGEIVVVQCGGEWITHRLLHVDVQSCQTYGDNLRDVDEPVSLANVVGRVVAIERAGRTLDLQHGVWLAANRMVGWMGRGKLRLLSAGRWVSVCLDRSAQPWRTVVASGVAAPFQLINRVVVRFAERF
jgi:hypothetical protein